MLDTSYSDHSQSNRTGTPHHSTSPRHLMSQPQERFLRLPEVMRIAGISRTQIHRLVVAGSFPKPIPLGVRTSAWIASEVDAWVQARISTARGRRA